MQVMARPKTGDPVLAARVRLRRKELRWTRKKFANEIGRSLDWVISLEGAKSATTLAGLHRLREVLRRPIGWLLGELPEDLSPELLEFLASLPPGSEELDDVSDAILLAHARAQRRRMKKSGAAGGDERDDNREKRA